MKALAIAATGMNAQQTNLEVIANNIANINTTGFKRARAEFSDLLYQVDRMQGVPNRANSSVVPEGVSHRPRRQDLGGAQRPHPGRPDQHRQQFRPGADRQRLVPDRGRRRPDALHPRRRLQHQRHRPAGHRRRLSGHSGDHRAGRCDRSHRQQVRPGLRPARRPGRAAESRPADACHLRQRGRPRAARRQSLPGDRRRRAPPMSACPAISATPRSSRAISKTPTSIRSRKSPS